MGCGRHQSVFPLMVVSQLNKQLLNGGHFLKSLKHLGALLRHLESGCQGCCEREMRQGSRFSRGNQGAAQAPGHSLLTQRVI